jgi:hypothetical protein
VTWRHDQYTLFVYLLLDDDGRAVYVGITNCPKTRRRVHYITARQHYRSETPLKLWLRARAETGLPLHMLVLEKIEGVRAARVREAAYIDAYLRLGCTLLNVAAMPRQERLGPLVD